MLSKFKAIKSTLGFLNINNIVNKIEIQMYQNQVG